MLEVVDIPSKKGQRQVTLFEVKRNRAWSFTSRLKKDLEPTSDKKIRLFIVTQYTNDDGDQTYPNFWRMIWSRKVLTTISTRKDTTQNVKLVCFRKDSPESTTLTMSYVALGESRGADSESPGLTPGFTARPDKKTNCFLKVLEINITD